MNDLTPDEEVAFIRKSMMQLSEHYDSVQIFVTRCEGDGTKAFNVGCGNYYARYGQVKCWMITEDSSQDQDDLS